MSDKPLYVRSGKVIDDIRAIAREHGYCVAEHGSMRKESDIDLVAAPWVKDAHAPRTLMRAINALPYLSRVKEHDKDTPKPHGRVDLSVMPRLAKGR